MSHSVSFLPSVELQCFIGGKLSSYYFGWLDCKITVCLYFLNRVFRICPRSIPVGIFRFFSWFIFWFSEHDLGRNAVITRIRRVPIGIYSCLLENACFFAIRTMIEKT